MRLAILAFTISVASGQVIVNGNRDFRGSVDAGSATRTAPVKTGTSLPATCTIGDIYFKTDATAGQNQYYCTATNTWTQQTGGGGAVGSAGAVQASNGSGANADSGCTATTGAMSCTKFAASGSGAGGFASFVPNAGVTGTTAKLLAKINSSGAAVIATTSDTSTPTFITLATDATIGCTAGTTGNACLVSAGQGTCTADAGGITAGHFVITSTATNGRCMDGSTTSPSVFSLGVAVSTCAANADCTVQVIPQAPATSSAPSDLGAMLTDGGASQTVNSNSETVAVLGTTSRDDGGFTGTANTLTVPTGKAGWYVISGGSAIGGSFSGICCYLTIGKNGTDYPATALTQPASGAAGSFSVVAYLSAGDAITMRLYQFTGGGTQPFTNKWLSLVRVN